MDPEQLTRLRALVAGALVLIVGGGTIDLILDDPQSWYCLPRHLRAWG